MSVPHPQTLLGWTVLVTLLVVIGWLLYARAVRVDRLHRQVLGARATLEAQLVHRAQAALELATSGLLDPASGLLLVPMTVGMLAAGIGSGILVTRTGRYRVYLIIGPIVSGAALLWMSTFSADTPVWIISTAVLVLGAGIGLFFQLLVTVVQNAVPARHLGTATSGNNFFREVAVSLGASLIGAAFSSGLTSHLTERIGDLARSSDPAVLAALAKFQDADTSSLTPALVNQLPTALHDAVASSYADALLPIFGWMIPLFVVTAVIGLFLPEVPLSRKTGMEQVAEAESAGSAEAEAESVSSQ